MILNADAYARVLGLDPRHGFQLPSCAEGKLGRVDPDLSPKALDWPVDRIVWGGFTLANVGMFVWFTWPWFLAVALALLASVVMNVRAHVRFKHLARAYPVPYFDI